MRRQHVLLLALLAVSGLSSSGLAQPVGRELRVNSYTTEDQERPSISSDPTGTFVVVWHSSAYDIPDQDGSGAGIFGRRYDSNQRRRLGSEFPINTYTTGSQQYASVSSDPAGNFVVVWESDGQDGSGHGIFGQRFGADGNPLGGEFQVNSYTTGSQRLPSVSSDSTGNFVVVWESDGQDGSNDGIFGQRFAADGTLLGDEFQVNTFTSSFQDSVAIASNDSGFLVVWESSGQDGSGVGVFGQRYLSDGSAVGEEFQVNTYTSASQDDPAVAANENGFVVVWGQYSYYAAGVSGQRYDSDGSRLGAEFLVSKLPEPGGGIDLFGATPHVAYDARGNFVAVWSYAYRTTDWHVSRVLARPYDADGNPVARQRSVNIETINRTDSNPRVAATPAGDFLVVWGAQTFSEDADISARRIKGQ